MWLDCQPGSVHALASFEDVIGHGYLHVSLWSMWLDCQPSSVHASACFEDVAAHASVHASAPLKDGAGLPT
eukprot:4696948-Prorocentrum_lima.AAC.1